MEYKDLYSTYDIFLEVESGTIKVEPTIRHALLQWLLNVCEEEKGRWKGGNPLDDLERLSEIMRDNIDNAKDTLEEPDRTREIRKNAMLWATMTRIRKDLEVRFR